jgi:hypothetical protein
MLKDILVSAAFVNAVDRLTKAAKKNRVDADEAAEIFAAVQAKHYPGKV